jgi:hemerythrin-like domain-containing protein
MSITPTVFLTVALAVATAASGCAAGKSNKPRSTTAAMSTTRPTEPFRHEHADIKEHLDHLKEEIGTLATSSPDEQRRVMQHVIGFLREHIKPHAEWEERVLYPAVDRRAASGPNPFTASMRYEHRIVARWTEELAALATASAPDVAAFMRRADNLLGLIWAHFEEEEEVLLPILDRTMTKEDFDREIGAHEG